MKIKEVLEKVNFNRPNAFGKPLKVMWLSELDAQLAAEVFMMSPEDQQQFRYSPVGDMQTELLVNFPYDRMYVMYLIAKIDQLNGEYSNYLNSAAIFNDAYSDFVIYFASNYEPVQGYTSELEE